MDDTFLFVPEAGSSASSARSQQRLVRAHVMRKQWQLVRNVKSGNSIAEEEKDDNKQERQKSARRKTTVVVPDTSTKKPPNKRGLPPSKSTALIKPTSGMALTRKVVDGPIGSIQSTFNEVGITMTARSFDFFDHFANEFNLVLCDVAQPIMPIQTDVFSTVAIHKSSPALTHAMCFLGAAHEALIRANPDKRAGLVKQQPEPESVLNEAIYHKHKCLQSLEQSFRSTNTARMNIDATVLAVVLLTASESCYGHFEHVAVHSNGLRQLVNMLGGVDKLPPGIRLHVYLAELKAATAQLRRHSFELPSYLRRRFEEHRYWPTMDESKDFPDRFTGPGSGFFTQSLLGPTNPRLIHCISYTRHLHNVKFFTRGQSDVYTIFDYIALDHEVLSLLQEPLNLLDQCIQTGLLLYSNTVFWKPPVFFNWTVQPRKRLFLLLKALDWQEALGHFPRLLLWLLVMGVFAIRLDHNAESDWWIEKFKEVVATIGLQSGSEARNCIHEFFYSEDVYGWVWQMVFTDEEPKDKRQPYPCVREKIEY